MGEDGGEEELEETVAAPDLLGVTRCLLRGGGEVPPASESPLDARLALRFVLGTPFRVRFSTTSR